MADILRLGSIVSVGEEKGMIIGYLNSNVDDKLNYRYIVLPYPAGYVNANSLKVLDIKDYEVVYEGYENQLTKAATTSISAMIALSEKYSYSEIIEKFDSIRMEEEKNE